MRFGRLCAHWNGPHAQYRPTPIGVRLSGALPIVMLLAALLPATAGGQTKLLEPERAFVFSVQAVDEKTVEARFSIASGYYLYREKLKFAVEPGTLAGAPVLPPGKVKDDAFFGNVETYRGRAGRAAAARRCATGGQGHGQSGVAGMRRCRSLLSAAGPDA